MRVASAITDIVATTAYFLKDVQVILNILHAAVVRQMLEQFLDILFRGLHNEITHQFTRFKNITLNSNFDSCALQAGD